MKAALVILAPPTTFPGNYKEAATNYFMGENSYATNSLGQYKHIPSNRITQENEQFKRICF